MFKTIVALVFVINLFANSCINCHKKQAIKCKTSNHFTLKNELYLIDKSWDIDKNLTFLKQDFLNKKCFRCHISQKNKNICLSCHNIHKNKQDTFMAKPEQKKCLSCHNNNFIGTDYLGLFPHDFDKSYRSPIDKKGFYPKRRFGIDYHHLIKDIHNKINFTCTSCHNQKISKNWEKISCKMCHKKISKKNHTKYHKKISCIACHSAWQVNSYEINLLRSDVDNLEDYKRLGVSEDIYFEKYLKSKIDKTKMYDFKKNKFTKGVWYVNYKFRRWENFFLINYKDKIELARTLFMYNLTYIDENNKTVINNLKFGGFSVAKPHTIIKEAKSCEMCHDNKLNLNDKSFIYFDIFKNRLLEGANLTKKQIEKLTSKKYKFIRAKQLF